MSRRAHGDDPAVVDAARAGVDTTGGPVLGLWASCAGGCEPEAAAELTALGWTDTTQERGSVHGVADLAGVYRTLWSARTVTRVVWRLHVGRAVDLDEPATVLRVELRGTRLQIGIELTGTSLHHRGHLVVRHHAGLKATIAACLLVTAGWRAYERLLDPMCDAGTIPLEAGLAALRWPPQRAAPPRLAILGLHEPSLARAVAAGLRTSALPPARLPIRGLDRGSQDVRAAQANAAAARLDTAVALERGDATLLDGIDEVDCVVTNPPYGKRMGRSGMVHGLYGDVLRRVAAVLSPAGRVVFLTSAPKVAASAAERAGLRLEARPAVSLGAFDAYACRFSHEPG